jgi:hypothetical protein
MWGLSNILIVEKKNQNRYIAILSHKANDKTNKMTRIKNTKQKFCSLYRVNEILSVIDFSHSLLGKNLTKIGEIGFY